MLHCRAHCPRPSICIMYGCGTAHETTLFARYCLVTPRQKVASRSRLWSARGGFGDGAPPCAVRAWIGAFGTIPGASDMPLACSARWYTWLRPKVASLGVSDLGAISSPLREVEIAPRSPTPRDASAGRSHVYQRAEHAKGISLAPGIVPKGQSRRARRTAAHRHQTPPGAPKPRGGLLFPWFTEEDRAPNRHQTGGRQGTNTRATTESRGLSAGLVAKPAR